ncbi:hypothetical protein BKA83DRAFT_4497931 [Pisolithus microcarpus]|nr:hypothetical protein BKA83DRAFT_4497931 [Pisolithus microcarpus]
MSMYTLNTTNTSFNSNGSSSLLLQETERLLETSGNGIEDPLIGLGPLSSLQQPFTPYLPQNPNNQVNGAYMQDSKVAYLQDRCNTLERYLVKVTSERDTIKNLFNQLMNAVKSMTCNLLLNSSVLTLPALMIMDEKAPMHELHPNVHFWTKKNFEDWLDSAEAQGSDRRIYAYLEDPNGNVPSSEMLRNMQKTLRGAWRELAFPLLKFAENGWKLEYICTRSYPTWSKRYLDESGNLKRTTRDTVKEEATNEEEDFQDHSLSGKKRKGHTEMGRLHNKKPKVETLSTVDTPKVTTVPHSNQPAPLPEEVAAKQLDSHQVSAIPSDKENLPVISDVTQPSVSYNPMSLLAVAVDKVKMIPLPPVPESPIKYDSVPIHAPEAKHLIELSSDTSKRTKFRPSGTKNGRNLCILRWLKQVNANSQKEEFCVYYEKTLTATQQEDYDNEAKQLVKDNGWVKAIIKNSKLY